MLVEWRCLLYALSGNKQIKMWWFKKELGENISKSFNNFMVVKDLINRASMLEGQMEKKMGRFDELRKRVFHKLKDK